MTIRISAALANALLAGSGVKDELDGGFLFIFSGPVPATADAALDMDNDHTQLCKIGADTPAEANPSTGLTFDAPSAAVLAKAAAETWTCVIAFDGADDGDPTLTPTFFRFCGPGDTGRGAGDGTTPRIQGTVAGPAAAADLNLGTNTLTDNTSNTQSIGLFQIRVPAAIA